MVWKLHFLQREENDIKNHSGENNVRTSRTCRVRLRLGCILFPFSGRSSGRGLVWRLGPEAQKQVHRY